MAIFYTDTGSFGQVQISGSGQGILTISGSTGPLLEVSDLTAGANVFQITSASIDIFKINQSKGVHISGSLLVTGSISLNGSAIGAGGNINVSAGVASSNVSQLVFSNSNNVSFGLNGATITATAGGAAANIVVAAGGSTNTVSQLVFSNAGGISFGLNGSTITATEGAYRSYYENIPVIQGTTNVSMGGSSMYMQPFLMPYNLSVSYIRMPITHQITSNTLASTNNTTINFRATQTFIFNIYSVGNGASSRSLQHFAQASSTMVYAITGQQGANTNQQSVSHAFTYPGEAGASATFSTSYSPASAALNFSTTHLTAFTGFRWIDIPFNSSLASGQWWMGVQRISSTAQTGAANLSLLTNQISSIMVSQISANPNIMGADTTVGTSPWQQGLGVWTTNSTGATTVSLALSQISTLANQPRLPLQFIRQE
jgi:hypothetical protein